MMFEKNDLIEWKTKQHKRSGFVLSSDNKHCICVWANDRNNPVHISTDTIKKNLIVIYRQNAEKIKGPMFDCTPKKHPKCLGGKCDYSGDFSCDYYSELDCDKCKYGMGRKDPEAKCNSVV